MSQNVVAAIESRVRKACYLALMALALIIWSLVQPAPLAVVGAMSVGQLFGTLSLLFFLYAMVADLRPALVRVRAQAMKTASRDTPAATEEPSGDEGASGPPPPPATPRGRRYRLPHGSMRGAGGSGGVSVLSRRIVPPASPGEGRPLGEPHAQSRGHDGHGAVELVELRAVSLLAARRRGLLDRLLVRELQAQRLVSPPGEVAQGHGEPLLAARGRQARDRRRRLPRAGISSVATLTKGAAAARLRNSVSAAQSSSRVSMTPTG